MSLSGDGECSSVYLKSPTQRSNTPHSATLSSDVSEQIKYRQRLGALLVCAGAYTIPGDKRSLGSYGTVGKRVRAESELTDRRVDIR